MIVSPAPTVCSPSPLAPRKSSPQPPAAYPASPQSPPQSIPAPSTPAPRYSSPSPLAPHSFLSPKPANTPALSQPPAQSQPGFSTHPGSFFTCRAAANTPCQFLIDFNPRPQALVAAAGRGRDLGLKWADIASR
ncbi:uncharacterized protein LOC135115145 [Scylla paramamosain]|uniref:uncharacterized protein LOC135115145 n=1 Tax=Scylla paramamosain TaxID=85552 RepID=UPI00308381BB